MVEVFLNIQVVLSTMVIGLMIVLLIKDKSSMPIKINMKAIS